MKCINDANTISVKLDGDLDAFFGGNSYLGTTRLNIPENLISDAGAVNLSATSASLITVTQATSSIIEDPFTGTYKVLVVRVTDLSGGQPTLSIAQLGTKTFDDTINLVSSEVHLVLCSFSRSPELTMLFSLHIG